ncbi:unnamed protein product, partial [Thlaspi arvense]
MKANLGFPESICVVVMLRFRLPTLVQIPDGRHHIRKWWDEAMMDEVNELIENVDDLSKRLNGLVSRPEMETLCHNLQKVVEEIEELKKTFEDPDLVEKIKELAKVDAHGAELQFKIAVVVGVVVIFMVLII